MQVPHYTGLQLVHRPNAAHVKTNHYAFVTQKAKESTAVTETEKCLHVASPVPRRKKLKLTFGRSSKPQNNKRSRLDCDSVSVVLRHCKDLSTDDVLKFLTRYFWNPLEDDLTEADKELLLQEAKQHMDRLIMRDVDQTQQVLNHDTPDHVKRASSIVVECNEIANFFNDTSDFMSSEIGNE